MPRKYVALAIVAVVLICTRPLEARMPGASCWSAYQSFLVTSWNEYDACIRETNDAPVMSRIGTRWLCRANWVSNAMQGELDYVGCMSMLDRLVGK